MFSLVLGSMMASCSKLHLLYFLDGSEISSHPGSLQLSYPIIETEYVAHLYLAFARYWGGRQKVTFYL